MIGQELGSSQCEQQCEPSTAASGVRKEKRKAAKKEKRKQLRKELAEKARQEEAARLNDPEEQRRIQLEEERENERLERERKKFEESERLFLEELARKKAKEEEEEERRNVLDEELKTNQAEHGNESNEDDDWEYVEEGPPEIIWQGNEIIVKKKRVKVKKKDSDLHTKKENADRPTSNPLPPQSKSFTNYQNAPAMSAQQLLENVAQQVPNFGTEQDKAHCPFHLKTGACRFGARCSRVHFYPDKSCTLLMKNMYNGPGLSWEQDEGLEHTDEEVERCYEEFYEDVHTEFLKFGEIINFKVCRNGAFHLRGNLYVHYKSLDSAVMAYHSMNGRYFAGKQVKCEFVGVTRWKIAICGEYMKSRLKTCSRGTVCNFIHCFHNPGGDYEWADWDKPPPRYWVDKMTALFGYSDESVYDKQIDQDNFGQPRKSSNMLTADRDRYHYRRSLSRERDNSNGRSSRSHYYEEHDDDRKSTHRHRHTSDSQKRRRTPDEKDHEETNSRNSRHRNYQTSDSDRDSLDRERSRKSSRSHHSKVSSTKRRIRETESDGDHDDLKWNSSRHWEKLTEIPHDKIRDREEDWVDMDGDGEKKHRDRTRKSPRNRHFKVAAESPEYHRGSRTHEADSDGGPSDSDRKRERHHGHKRKSSKHRKKE